MEVSELTMEKNGQDNSASNRCTSCGKPINLSDGKRLCADCDNDEDMA
jgi:NMD protein affecting ribosome stability and mRNA decay